MRVSMILDWFVITTKDKSRKTDFFHVRMLERTTFSEPDVGNWFWRTLAEQAVVLS
jgi:hypothetical protein